MGCCRGLLRSGGVVIVALLCFCAKGTSSAGAGRAFPIASENYVIESFKRINPRLDWDHTNYLVDLSGYYANCRYIGTRGVVDRDKVTPEGQKIAAYVDYTDGRNSDVNSVNAYLKNVIDRWMRDEHVVSLIRAANKFGCSVRPGCSDQVSISCLFSPTETFIPEPPPNIEEGKQIAQAFTNEQYRLTETITGNRWDRSYFLENLSGFETDCTMIGNDDWQFTQVQRIGAENNLRLFGTYGYAPNRGRTETALESILQNMKRVSRARRVGCSLIPDCKLVANGNMYVVVSCVYEE